MFFLTESWTSCHLIHSTPAFEIAEHAARSCCGSFEKFFETLCYDIQLNEQIGTPLNYICYNLQCLIIYTVDCVSCFQKVRNEAYSVYFISLLPDIYFALWEFNRWMWNYVRSDKEILKGRIDKIFFVLCPIAQTYLFNFHRWELLKFSVSLIIFCGS